MKYKKHKTTIFAVASVLTLATGTSLLFAGKELTMKDLPETVSQAILKAANGNKVSKIEKELRDNVTVFEVDWKTADGDFSVIVNEKGELLEQESPAREADLPEAVKVGVERAYPGFKTEKVEKVVRGSLTIMELEGTVGAVEYELEVGLDGAILKASVEKDKDNEKGESKEKGEDKD